MRARRPTSMSTKRLPIAVLAFLIVIASEPAANAMYVDPGSGLFLLQAAIAGVLGALFHFRRAFAHVLSFFRRKETAPAETSADAGE